MTRSREFPCQYESVAAARRFVRKILRDQPSETLEAAELMVSELATNCIRHARTAFELTIDDSRGLIRVELSDSGSGLALYADPRDHRSDRTRPADRGGDVGRLGRSNGLGWNHRVVHIAAGCHLEWTHAWPAAPAHSPRKAPATARDGPTSVGLCSRDSLAGDRARGRRRSLCGGSPSAFPAGQRPGFDSHALG